MVETCIGSDILGVGSEQKFAPRCTSLLPFCAALSLEGLVGAGASHGCACLLVAQSAGGEIGRNGSIAWKHFKLVEHQNGFLYLF